MNILTLDSETSIYNKGNPFDPRNICVSLHTKLNASPTKCKFYDEPDFTSLTRKGLSSAKLLVGCAIKFDIHWLTNLGIKLPVGIRVWDCMLAEFILSGQTNSFASLNSMAEFYGLGQKHDEVADYWKKGISTEDIPREIVEEYGNWDVDLTYQVYLKQLEDPRMTDKIRKLILLDGADLLVLQEMEYNGLKYNKGRSLELATECQQRIKELEDELFRIGGITKLNFDSDDQLSAYLYGGSYSEDLYTPVVSVYKSGPRKGQEYTQNRFVETITHNFGGFFNPIKGTALKKEGLYSTAGDVLKQLRATTKMQKLVIGALLERADLNKLSGTYYAGIPQLMETMGWTEYIHPNYNQVIARTGRLSSSKPNAQNFSAEGDVMLESRFDY